MKFNKQKGARCLALLLAAALLITESLPVVALAEPRRISRLPAMRWSR